MVIASRAHRKSRVNRDWECGINGGGDDADDVVYNDAGDGGIDMDKVCSVGVRGRSSRCFFHSNSRQDMS